jgi:hypothetical protein
MNKNHAKDKKPLRWPDRLKESSALLCEISNKINMAINTTSRFSLLIDSENTSADAINEVREFDNLLVSALTVLIDLTAYENSEQEYPNLELWFEFKCSNVVFGRKTDIISSLLSE